MNSATQQKEEKTVPNPDEIARHHEKIMETKRRSLEQKPISQDSGSDQNKVEPVPAESKEPHPAETTPHAADHEAKVQAAQGASIPIGSIRPKPSPGAKEEGSVIVAKALAEQLGTAPELKASMRIDERKVAVLTDAEVAALSHFSYRYAYDGVRYWGHLVEWQLTGSQGVGGLGRRHILQALANTSGIQTIEKAEKPNPVARNLWARDWKDKALKQGKVPEE